MNLCESEIALLSGYKSRAAMRRWVKKHSLYRLNPPGRDGRVSATYVGPSQKAAKEPNFAGLAAKGTP